MATIVTLTMNPALDTSTAVDRVVPEHKLRCGPLRFAPGGGGINVARAIRQLGGTAKPIYTCGGPFGRMLQQLLDAEGLEHQPVTIAGQTRASFTAGEEASDQQYRFTMPGPQIQATEWQHCLEILSSLDPRPDYLVAGGSLPPGVPDDFYAQVAQITAETGTRLIVDTSGEALHSAVYRGPGIYAIKPNLRELRTLARDELADERQQEKLARSLIEQGRSEVVMLSLGAAGGLLVTAEGSERLRAPTVPIRSKIGAGDSTVAGFTLGLARDMALRDAVRFGVAAGAAAVMTPGTALCRREDTERLHEQIAVDTDLLS